MIRTECSTCPYHRSPDWCSRVAHGMACVVPPRPGAVVFTPGPIAAAGAADNAIYKSIAKNYEPKASATQVAGDHYKKMGVEPWDVVDTWPLEQRIGAYRHGALKYLMRMGSKDQSAQEIAKGKHYMEKLLEVLQSAA